MNLAIGSYYRFASYTFCVRQLSSGVNLKIIRQIIAFFYIDIMKIIF